MLLLFFVRTASVLLLLFMLHGHSMVMVVVFSSGCGLRDFGGHSVSVDTFQYQRTFHGPQSATIADPSADSRLEQEAP